MKDYSSGFGGWDGKGSNASASATRSYHNGGVEGDSFASWYDQHLADRYSNLDDDNNGSGGTKGSGSGGTKGSGSGGTKGSGSGGTKGSGSGGTKGSGSGGTKGSGSGGTHGTECDVPDDTGSGKLTQNYTMGTDPQVSVSVTQTPSGTLFFDLKPTSYDSEPADINGLFFNLTNDSEVASLVFYPDANQGSQYSPVTGTQADANAVDTLSNGATAPGQFDAAVQFGTQDDTTNGLVQSVNFTLSSADGPLTFGDIDLGSMTLLADSGSSGSLVMSVTGSDDDDCEHTSGTKGSGSGGTKGSGSGGTKGSGSGGTKGSGSGGTKGSGSGGTKGSGSGGTKGSGSGGTKGSGSGGTKGTGSGGTKGSGSGGTKGSGSGGTKGSGSDGTKGASASTTEAYHNGGVEGGAFADWYDENLADKFNEPADDDIKGSGSGGTKGSGSGGTKGSGSASSSSPGLSDFLALMTEFPDEDDPSLKDEDDPWDDVEPDLLI